MLTSILRSRKRRLISIGLILVGGLLMFVIHDIWLGAILFTAGMLLDMVGIVMTRVKARKRP